MSASKISDSEWEVLNIVWSHHPILAGDVLKKLPDENSWKQKTVNTFLTRLIEKSVLHVKREGKVNLYSPKLSPQECIKSAGRSFLQKVFKGAVGPMLLHFVEGENLSDHEIRELEEILKKKREQ